MGSQSSVKALFQTLHASMKGEGMMKQRKKRKEDKIQIIRRKKERRGKEREAKQVKKV